jgi:hypothetical protein
VQHRELGAAVSGGRAVVRQSVPLFGSGEINMEQGSTGSDSQSANERSTSLGGLTVRDDMVAVLRTVFRDRSGVYASAPITSGKRAFDLDIASCSADIQYERVTKPNLEDARAFGAKLRRSYGARVIDPSRLPFLHGWSQKHYYSLWGEVVRAHVSLGVFIDGWQYSSGCTYEFLVGTLCGISLVDQDDAALTEDVGLNLMRSACEELVSRKKDPAFLRDRILQLTMRELLPIVVPWERARAESSRKLCLAILGCVLDSSDATVVFSHANSAERVEASEADVVAAVWAVLNRITTNGRSTSSIPVIDTSRFAPRHWPRQQLWNMWRDVVRTYVDRVILPPNWHLSDDLVSIFLVAVRSQRRVFDYLGEPIRPEAAVPLLQAVVESGRHRGLNASAFEAAIKEIRDLISNN